ncbi:Dabb family protein [Niveibacterium sp. 24ML]|uniref:Dabb family protein n=1 Tax=Niveibacterium sp. 24ML TaxID=2985512 RepID=UPI00226F14C5|nr:Dabb family protein [Niveibacterium sp. 24ML]MCX9156097.1 Dabb family protein [Niveibacterium sp. 24ML]
MITHVVLLRLKPGVAIESDAAQSAHSAMCALPALVPGIRAWQCGFNSTPDEVSGWDYVLVSAFDDRAALLAYFDHPAHLKVVAMWEPIADLAFGDLEA